MKIIPNLTTKIINANASTKIKRGIVLATLIYPIIFQYIEKCKKVN